MLRGFWALFPVWLVGMIARRKCERFQIGYITVARAFPGVYFQVADPGEQGDRA